MPVTDQILPGDNTLTVSLRPATNESLALRDAHPYSIPAIAQLGSIGAYNFARKPASGVQWTL